MSQQAAPVPAAEPDAYQSFMERWRAKVQRQGYWSPPITDKQRNIVAHKERFVLLSGPRHTGKTIAGLHGIADHCWNVPDANVAFISISQTNLVDSGAWPMLGDKVMQSWIDGQFGMQWVEEPRFSTYSHKPYFEVTNQWGGTAHVQIYSLPDERKVDEMFKNKEFTMVFITELSKFKQQKTFVTIVQTLRGIGRPQSHFKFLADTNPAEDGTASWIWQLWFAHQTKPEAELTAAQKQYRAVKFRIEDNEFYSEAYKEEIRQMFEYDKTEYARNWLGEWVAGQEGTFFGQVFHYNHHCPGDTDEDFLTVGDNCTELITGWDLGGGINHSMQIIEPCEHMGEQAFKIIDEVVSVGIAVGIKDIVKQVVERMDFWEAEIGKKVIWRHWSDDDIFKFDAGASTYKHLIVFAESGGRIELRKATKGPGSVAPRFNLVKRLLFDNRLYFSRRCPRTIDAVQTIKIEKRLSKGPVDVRDDKKHAIDSFSYALYMETGEEARNDAILTTKRDTSRNSGLVQIQF